MRLLLSSSLFTSTRSWVDTPIFSCTPASISWCGLVRCPIDITVNFKQIFVRFRISRTNLAIIAQSSPVQMKKCLYLLLLPINNSLTDRTVDTFQESMNSPHTLNRIFLLPVLWIKIDSLIFKLLVKKQNSNYKTFKSIKPSSCLTQYFLLSFDAYLKRSWLLEPSLYNSSSNV